MDYLQILVYCLVLCALVKPLGSLMASVYAGDRHMLTRPLGWLEKLVYRGCGIDPAKEMPWRAYAGAVLMMGAVSFVWLYAMLLLQPYLPYNPQNLPAPEPHLAFNIAISFITNTNWQSYAGESTLSPLLQMAGLAVQNFLSAATGMAVAVALFRGLKRSNADTIGNFWADLVRGVVYILLPLSVVFALAFSAQGVVQSMKTELSVMPLQVMAEGKTSIKNSAASAEPTKQAIAIGPVASQEAIKQLGTNGGGYFNANSAHPYENPTALTNFLQCLAILLIPAALVYSFGVMVGDRRQGWTIFAAMLIIFVPFMLLCVHAEQQSNPLYASYNLTGQGNMEGKEVRFGPALSALWATATTAASNGSVNAMHDSFTPIGGLVPMMMMQFGEVIFGGAGSGMYGMIMYAFIAVFIGGLMVGRTPEYLGKKLSVYEIKMAAIASLIPYFLILPGTAIAVMTTAGNAGILNQGAQGFSEVLYAMSSAANNNGSAFAGLSANTPFYNIMLGIMMFVGRYFIIIPILAVAGSLAAKNRTPMSAGTMPTHTPLFVGFLVSVVLLFGVLTFVPALAIGPIAEYFHLHALAAGANP